MLDAPSKTYKILAGFCCLLVLLCLTLAKSEAAAEAVRTGIVESPGYAERDADGVERGFDAEYTYKVGQYANLKINFVAVSDYRTMLDMLETGELDMAVGVAKTPKREERFLFADNWFGRGNVRIVVRSADDRFVYGERAQFNGKKIGAIRGSSMVKEVENWCRKNNLETEVIEYPSETELRQALNEGIIDGWCMGGDQTDIYRTVLEFAPTGYYAAFNKQESALKNKIDGAMFRIGVEEKFYETKLRDKYRKGSFKAIAALTREENTYALTHPSVKVAVVADSEPYFAWGADGPRGIIPDYYALLGRHCELRFSYEQYSSYEEAVAAVQSGAADVLGMIRGDTITAMKQGLLTTATYTTFRIMQLTRVGTATINTAAVNSENLNFFQWLLRNERFNPALQSYGKAEACFQALKQGKVDAVLCGSPSAIWLLNQHHSANYVMTNIGTLSMDFCGGVTQDNAALGSILSKAALASGTEVDGIVAKNTLPKNDFMTFVNRLPLSWIVTLFVIVLLALILITLLLFHAYHQRQKARLATAQAEVVAAEKAREAEAQFLSNMSHDMRTPLNGVIGFTELALNDADQVQRQNYLEKINLSGRFMLALVNDILDLSKIVSGKLELVPAVFQLQEFYDSVLAAVRLSAQQKQIKLEAEAKGLEGCYVRADQLRLQQVLLNLLSNAVKYTPQGGKVCCGLELSEATGDKSHLTIRVQDSGIGMSEEFQKRMFEPFSQENQLRAVQGTGLGLSIVKQIVDLMGGKIDVISQRNQGTIFTVYLPVTRAVAPEHLVKTEVKLDLTNRRILFCEDNAINGELTKTILMKQGMLVEWAKDGQEGVKKFSVTPTGYYDAILMDVRMPVLDGLAATKAIRHLDREDAKTIPIIAFTADAYAEDIAKCKAAGMNGHVAKPLVPADLFTVLAQNLKIQ